MRHLLYHAIKLFQSTPLLRGATHCGPTGGLLLVVSIHAPLARGDPFANLHAHNLLSFNPRPSCEGRPGGLRLKPPVMLFQSTPLLRGATGIATNYFREGWVSIHAPLARGDGTTFTKLLKIEGFNPRPSCEGRQFTLFSIKKPSMFQSTPLLRGATSITITFAILVSVSIHAPLARGDDASLSPTNGVKQFQSTPLLRGATGKIYRKDEDRSCFNPRPSCEGRHGPRRLLDRQNHVSIHAPLARGDLCRR